MICWLSNDREKVLNSSSKNESIADGRPKENQLPAHWACCSLSAWCACAFLRSYLSLAQLGLSRCLDMTLQAKILKVWYNWKDSPYICFLTPTWEDDSERLEIWPWMSRAVEGRSWLLDSVPNLGLHYSSRISSNNYKINSSQTQSRSSLSPTYQQLPFLSLTRWVIFDMQMNT